MSSLGQVGDEHDHHHHHHHHHYHHHYHNFFQINFQQNIFIIQRNRNQNPFHPQTIPNINALPTNPNINAPHPNPNINVAHPNPNINVPHPNPNINAPPRRPPLGYALSFPLIHIFGFLLFLIFRHHVHYADKTLRKFPLAVLALALSIQTITSVGYGDVSPGTVALKIVSSMIIIVTHGAFNCFGDFFLDWICYWFRIKYRAKVGVIEYNANIGKIELWASIGVPLLFIGVGALGLYFIKDTGVSLGDAFYLALVTMSTVGYGDIAIQSWPGVLFASLWMMIACPVFGKCSAHLSKTLSKVLVGEPQLPPEMPH